jgi:hypothetical protein
MGSRTPHFRKSTVDRTAAPYRGTLKLPPYFLYLYYSGRNVKPPSEREVRIVLDDVPEDEAMMSSLWVSLSEGAHIDVLF